MKIGYLAAILKRYKYLKFFSWNVVVISVYTYGVKITIKFRWESGFLWGVPWNPPLCTNGSAGYLMQLSVKMNHWIGQSQVIYLNTTHLSALKHLML